MNGFIYRRLLTQCSVFCEHEWNHFGMIYDRFVYMWIRFYFFFLSLLSFRMKNYIKWDTMKSIKLENPIQNGNILCNCEWEKMWSHLFSQKETEKVDKPKHTLQKAEKSVWNSFYIILQQIVLNKKKIFGFFLSN